MTHRKAIRELKRVFESSQEAVIQYLIQEIKLLLQHLGKRPKPSKTEKALLARAAKAVDPVRLERTFNLFTPATLFRWYRELVRKKWDHSRLNKKPGRPRIDHKLEKIIVQLALENPRDGYGTLVGRLKILHFHTNEETVRNVLKRNGIAPSPDRKHNLTWTEFLKHHWDSLVATDFFTWEVLTEHGLVSYFILFFIRLKDRKVHVAGITTNPNGLWMAQMARNLTDPLNGFLKKSDILIHDRDGKYTSHFMRILNEIGIVNKPLPPESPNLNAYAERFVRTIKEQCLSRLLITSEEQLRKAIQEFVIYYHEERPHQGIGNVIPFPHPTDNTYAKKGKIKRRSRLGHLLNYYHRVQNDETVKVLA